MKGLVLTAAMALLFGATAFAQDHGKNKPKKEKKQKGRGSGCECRCSCHDDRPGTTTTTPDPDRPGSTERGPRRGPKGNNGVGNGFDPQPPGNPPVNDGGGTAPGHPGNRGGKKR